MIDQKDCRHVNLVKAGKIRQSGRIRQRLQCKDCGKLILDGEIS